MERISDASTLKVDLRRASGGGVQFVDVADEIGEEEEELGKGREGDNGGRCTNVQTRRYCRSVPTFSKPSAKFSEYS